MKGLSPSCTALLRFFRIINLLKRILLNKVKYRGGVILKYLFSSRIEYFCTDYI